MSVPTLAAPAAAPQLAAPAAYPEACTDLTPRPVPAVTVPPNVNDTFKDPSFNRTIRRLTNGTTGSSGNQGCSHRTPSSEQACAWGRRSDRFFALTTHGTVEYFTFDASTGKATYVRDLPFSSEPTFSRVQPSVVYGVSGFKVLAYDTDTGTETVVFDLAQADPAYATAGLYMGSVQSSASLPERLTVFYGGGGQDKHFRVCVFEPANPANRLTLDTQALTVNGQAVIMQACHVHAVGLDQGGRFVLVYPTYVDIANKVPQTYVWDTVSSTLTGITVAGGGHACDGYAVHVNQDSGAGVPWDALQYQYRYLFSVGSPANVLTTPLTPKEVYLADHAQWNNARADAAVPFVTGTYRYDEDAPRNPSTDPNQRGNTVPWRAGDNELLAINPATGALYRFCHHFADIYPDAWAAGQGDIVFWYEPIPQVSPDGRWILFDSNMGKALGADVGSKDPQQQHRTDLFVIDTAESTRVVTVDPAVVGARLDALQAAADALSAEVQARLAAIDDEIAALRGLIGG